MINKNIVDEAISFYNIDHIYKDKCYRVIEEINNSEKLYKAFFNIYKKLYKESFKKIKKLWNIKNINELFTDNINPFVTNIMILCGYKIHKENMNKYNFNNEQISISKKRVKECFENDLKGRKYGGIRISQMLWAIYFIRAKIIEIGSLQFELENNSEVKIHIPKNTNLNIEKVNESKLKVRAIIENKNVVFKCESWLLSNQIYEIIDKNTNISKFYNLFNIAEGEECTLDILNFVFGIDNCQDYATLPTNTSLQRKIKKQLLNCKKFYLGCGKLK